MELSQEHLDALQDVNLDEIPSYEPVIRYGNRGGEPEVTLAYLRKGDKKRNDLVINRAAVDLMKFKGEAYHVAFKFGIPDMLIIWANPPKSEPQFVMGHRSDGKVDKAIKFSNQVFCQDVIEHFKLSLPTEGNLLNLHFKITEYSGKFILTLRDNKITKI